MEFNWPTVLSSFIVSLGATYIGVRFFTGPRLRAEMAHSARVAIRDAVSPRSRDVRAFRAKLTSATTLNLNVTQDAVEVQQLLQLAVDLPLLARRRFTRRLRRIYSSGWVNLAQLRMTTTGRPEPGMATEAAIDQLKRINDKNPPEYWNGLLYLAYKAGPTSKQAKQLDRQLRLLAMAK